MNQMKFSTLDKACMILIPALLLCLLHMPYGYYILVRFLAFIIFGCLTYRYYNEKKEDLAIMFGAIALLFQPFFKIVLGRAIWNIVDVIVAIILGFILYKRYRLSK